MPERVIGKGYIEVTTPEGEVVKVPAISGFHYRMAIVRRVKAGEPIYDFEYSPEKIMRLLRMEIKDNIREYEGDVDKAIKYAFEDLANFIQTFRVRVTPALNIEEVVKEVNRFYPQVSIERIRAYADVLKRAKLERVI